MLELFISYVKEKSLDVKREEIKKEINIKKNQIKFKSQIKYGKKSPISKNQMQQYQ